MAFEGLPTDQAYGLWAAGYDAENAVTTLEDSAVRELTPVLEGKRLLDAACGTARRLTEAAAGAPALSVGVDRVPAMLSRARTPVLRVVSLVRADFRRLPLASGVFDVVWCRLALGHAADPAPVYRELARVTRRLGTVIVTDFHSVAVAAGHRRTFCDPTGTLRAVEHHVHELDDHVAAAGAAGLILDEARHMLTGPAVRRFYEDAGALERYEADRGLPIVLALRFLRRAETNLTPNSTTSTSP